MEYFSVIKKNEVLIHLVALMNLEDIVLSKKSLSQKTDIISFIQNVQNRESTKTESILVVA